jgi:hypothetical protein
LPDLGVAPKGSTILQPHYLVLDRHVEVQVRVVPQRRGGVAFAIDEVANPSAAVLVPGGWCGDRCLVVGQLKASSDPRSHELARRLARTLFRSFTKRGQYRLGPAALAHWESGGRLSHDCRAPVEFDPLPR